MGISITGKLLKNKCVAITERGKKLICGQGVRGKQKPGFVTFWEQNKLIPVKIVGDLCNRPRLEVEMCS